MRYEDKNKRFEFEKFFCLDNLQTWANEAHNLFYSAEVLLQFEELKTKNLFEHNEPFSLLFSSDLTNRGYFNFRVQRMLWAYAFENLLKLIILARIKNENPEMREVPFKEINSHDLKYLAQKAGIELTEPEGFYLQVLEKSAVWAGRYPIPVKSSQMDASREPMPSREALIERSKQTYEKWLKGEIPRVVTESNVIHGGISSEEYSIYRDLKERLFKIAEAYCANTG